MTENERQQGAGSRLFRENSSMSNVLWVEWSARDGFPIRTPNLGLILNPDADHPGQHRCQFLHIYTNEPDIRRVTDHPAQHWTHEEE